MSLGRGLGKNNWIAFINSFGKMEKRKFNFKLLNWASNLKDTNLKMCHVFHQMSSVRTCNKFSAAGPYFDISEGVLTFFQAQASTLSVLSFHGSEKLWQISDIEGMGWFSSEHSRKWPFKRLCALSLRLVQATRTLRCHYPFPLSSCHILIFPLELKRSLYPYLP